MNRFLFFIVLLVLATVIQLIRIGNVQSSTGEMPFLSANDRSRWCTILALTVTGSYAVDDIIEIRDPKTKRRTWYTIDLVQHRGRDGQQHFYSSKPPLLATIYAGVYWVVRGVTGATLTSQPFQVVRWMLILVNLLPLIGLWWLLFRWADQAWLDDWQIIPLVTFALFGTFLSTFVITLNNHLPAAVAAAVSLVCLQRVLIRKDHRPRWFVLCGLATSFTAANELPALSWVAAAGCLLFLENRRLTCLAFAPAILPVLLAFLGTNYLAHGTLRPAYSMRDVGRKIAELDWPIGDLVVESQETSDSPLLGDGTKDPAKLVKLLNELGYQVSSQSVIRKARQDGVWELWDEASQWRFALRFSSDSERLNVHHWGDWYDYPNTYWQIDRKQGVDRGEPSRLRYAVHCLIGHHGVLSLTPFWWISLLGFAVVVRGKYRERYSQGSESEFQSQVDSQRESQSRWWCDGELQLTLAIAATSLVVMAFYLLRPLEDRNYGGVTSGLRWMFWFVPLWFWLAVRGMSVIRERWQLVLVGVLLAISIFSAAYPWSNPWTSPWLTRWFLL